jgi:hypothetical protein
MEGVWP